jgi:ATP-dependent Clp protease ATP-binding subunit ClpC
MFERYTESARRALFFSRYEASQFGSLYIGTEHLLLGLIRESEGVLGRILTAAKVSLPSVRAELEGFVQPKERLSASVEIPFDSHTKRALAAAAEEADRLGHNYIGAEHLFLGLLDVDGSIATSLLHARGIHAIDVRQSVTQLLAEQPGKESDVAARIDHIRQLVNHISVAHAGDEAAAIIGTILANLETLRRLLTTGHHPE